MSYTRLKIGTISDGISQDFEEALDVMDELGLKYVEIDSLWGKNVGDLSAEEIKKVKDLVAKRGIEVSCISPYPFFRTPLLAKPSEKSFWGSYAEDLETLKRCIKIAKELGVNLVRVFSFKTESVLFGSERLTGHKGWEGLVKRFKELVKIAEKESVIFVIETGMFFNIATAALAKRLIDEIGSGNLRVLWDPCNTLYSDEVPYPDGYELIKDYIAHVHIKDAVVDQATSTYNFRPLGQGQMGKYVPEILRALKKDGYQGVICLENVYVPEKGTKGDGLRTFFATLKKVMEVW